jgi:glycerol-3-phosphate dehydrogenase (NAD(P)+)
MRLRVGVLGAGSWGTTVATLASHNTPTVLWARRPELVDEINDRHTNERYLPGFALPDDLPASNSIADVVGAADVVVMGVPSHGFRSVLKEVADCIRPWVPVVSLAKGLEQGTHLRMTELISEILPDHRAGVLTGPNLSHEIMEGFAAAAVVAIDDDMIAHQLQGVFHSGLFRVYTNRDVIGCELGGALKNVIAIASGMGDGLGVGDNTRSAVITRGLAELERLGVAMGGQTHTFSGLAGMGDLVATCISRKSRNRHVGEQLARRALRRRHAHCPGGVRRSPRGAHRDAGLPGPGAAPGRLGGRARLTRPRGRAPRHGVDPRPQLGTQRPGDRSSPPRIGPV